MIRKILLISLVIGGLVALLVRMGDFALPSSPPDSAAKPAPVMATAGGANADHLRAIYSPLHFQPAIATATDEQCLVCHREVLEDKVRKASPAGVLASNAKAWYQEMSTYAGEQETFHRRHLVTPYAQKMMKLKCNTCHEGHDPREEAPGAAADSVSRDTQAFTLRKQVNPETTCLKCHGQMNWQVMALPGPWPEVAEQMGNSCLACHAAIRTNRHQVNYLDAEAIETAAQDNAEVCYGCHGGRAWYRTHYPYPRTPWPDMPDAPDELKTRPTHSEARFLKDAPQNHHSRSQP